MRNKNHKSRLYLIFLIFIFILTFYITRIISLQLFKSPYLSKLAHYQHNILLVLEPERGDIFDRNLRPLALDLKVDSIYAVPKEMDQDHKLYAARALSPILKLDKDTILNRLNQDKSFIWIKREIDKESAEEIKRLDLNGIGLIKEYKRFYPNGPLASHLIGFAGVDDVGLEGVELAYNGYLKGSPGWRWTVRDAKRRDILSKDIKFIPPSDGFDVVLTIDEAIQHIAERELDGVYKKYNPKGASIIVMDPENGDILALANRPTFDLNTFSSSTLHEKRNRAVTDLFEPGSIFKVVTASCAIEKKLVDLEEKFFCEDGRYYVGGRILHDHTPHGTLTFREIIEKSSNIGVTKIAQILGKENIYKFIKLFGFGMPTDIDIPGEVNGIIRPPSQWSAVSISAIPIGQEVAVTSIQLVTAISAIANGGRLVRPRVVREIRDKDGNIVKSFTPLVSRRVLKEESCDIMKGILRGVVEKGTGRRASLDMYTAAGKTGTAQKLEPDGRYSHTKFIASFMGFAPADKPKVAIIVNVDEPRPVYYGGAVAAPAFRNVATDILKYLKVEPDKMKESIKL